ncbi:hypothetical protein [Mycobacteroides abscessus]|uniref:hypothetical protein n=1 Tax=Mycobacteroides abscessus TaxID=36809 RepID=UPI0013000846|nr:hypothetical protein [Mycobacteroides abscessus]
MPTALESAAKVVPEEEQPDLAWPQDPFWRRKIRLAREAHRLGQQLNAMARDGSGTVVDRTLSPPTAT